MRSERWRGIALSSNNPLLVLDEPFALGRLSRLLRQSGLSDLP